MTTFYSFIMNFTRNDKIFLEIYSMKGFFQNHTICNQIFIVLLSVVLLSACLDTKIKKQFKMIEDGECAPHGIAMVYPQNSTIFPPEFPPPTFQWDDSVIGSKIWNIYISDSSGNVLCTSTSIESTWKPDPKIWEQIKKTALQQQCFFTVISDKKSNGYLASGRINFSFSADSVGAEIFYRAVTLPFSYAVNNVHTIEWYMGSVDGSKPRKMLDNLPVCGNCHSFSSQQALLAMDVDYGNDKGSYVIADTKDTCSLNSKNIISWSKFKRDDNEPTYGLLSQISPSGNHVLSTVKDLSIFVAVDENFAYSQLFFPIKGVVGVYDRMRETFSSLPGANNEKYVQSNPTWSPDGKQILFARTNAYVNEKVRASGRALLSVDDVAEFTSGGKQFKYDLYSLDFNNGKGGEPKPLQGASNNGKSNYFPKYSPDGKWLVFCRAENFMLLQPDSRLYIMPAQGGQPRLMNCNMHEMNSWHSWSPNSRWLVFASKNRGPYTQLYLTHVDENGMDSPAVLLENFVFDKRAANIPEFFPFNADSFTIIRDDFSNTAEYINRGAFDKISNKQYKSAFDELNRAIKTDSAYLETYFNRILLNDMLKQSNSNADFADKQKAMQLVLDSLAKNPDDENYLSLKVSLLSNMGQVDQALAEAQKAIKIHPQSYKLYDLLSTIYRKLNRFEKAIDCYRQMIKIDRSKKYTIDKMIVQAYMNSNQYATALSKINSLIEQNPLYVDLYSIRAQILMQLKRYQQAKNDIDYLIEKNPDNYTSMELLAQYYIYQGDKQNYNHLKEKSIALLGDTYDKNYQNIDVLFELASHYLASGDIVQAEKQYSLILEQFPNNYEALKQKAKIKLRMQQWPQAISAYNMIEANYPPEEEVYNNKAIAYIQIGDKAKALEYFDRTIELNPENSDAVYNRNLLQRELE